MTDEDFSLVFLSLCTHSECGEEGVEDRFDDLATIQEPNLFQSRDVYVDSENVGELEVFHSTSTPETPDVGQYSALEYDVNEDWAIHIHSYMELERYKKVLDFHKDILDITGSADVSHLDLFFLFDGVLNDLSIDPFPSEEYKPTGYQIEYEDMHYSFMEVGDSVRGRASYTGDKSISDGGIHEFVQSNIDIGRAFLDGVVNQ